MPTTLSTERRAELDGALASGCQLTSAQLAYHIGVDRKNAPKIAKSFGLEPEGRHYPWRRIWRCLHNTEGALLPAHLVGLKDRYPGSVLLAGVEDLEVALRVPLMSFARMSEALGRRSDTLSKALREGRETLPFPLITLGPRTRVFRKLEVRLWAEEEIRLDLPKALGWTTPAPEQVEGGVEETEGSSFLDEDPLSADPAKKAIFGQFAGPKQKPAT